MQFNLNDSEYRIGFWVDLTENASTLNEFSFTVLMRLKFDGKETHLAKFLREPGVECAGLDIQFTRDEYYNAKTHCLDKIQGGVISRSYLGALTRADPRHVEANKLLVRAQNEPLQDGF